MTVAPMTPLEEMIAHHPFLKGIDPNCLPVFYQSASLERHGIGELIFREGAPAERFYLIQSGEIALETFIPGRGRLTIQTLTAGEALGWSWMFSPFTWHFTARATAPSETIVFAACDLLHQAEANALFGRELALRVSRILLQRLQATRLQLLDFYALGC